MSFILDALKKSESERQRQAGPALFEVKVAPPRHRVAPWAAVLGALLLVNLAVVGWMLVRSSAGPGRKLLTTPVTAVSGPPASRGPSLPSPRAVLQSASVASLSAAQPARAPNPAGGSQVARRRAQGTPAGPAGTPHAKSGTGNASPPSPGPSSTVDHNPADFAPAMEPASDRPARTSSGSVVHESEASLPSYHEIAAVPGADLPSLRLDLHVYARRPAQRFVFLNMVKLREGQALPNGVRVDRITPDGVILSYAGKRFVLHRK